MNVTKGKQGTPIKALAYGPEGIGKSTLASRWPAPLFVDLEGGTARLDVDRVTPGSWSAVTQVVDELTRDRGPYRTVVFDTADWLDRQAVEHVCAANNWAKGIETPGYGKGYTYVAEAWKAFLDRLAAMQSATDLHVLFLAHSAMRKVELPDEAGQFDRWELKLSKYASPLLKEWTDLVLFLNYRTLVVQTDSGKAKAQGGERVMYATHHPCWDAKNRFGLPDVMPLEFKSIAGLFTAAAAVQPPPTPAKPAPAVPDAETPADLKPAAPAPEPKVIDDPERPALLKQLAELMTGSGISKEELGAELARKGVCPADMSPRAYNVATLKRLVSGWAAVSHNIATRRQVAA